MKLYITGIIVIIILSIIVILVKNKKNKAISSIDDLEIYYINMDASKERRAHIVNQLKKQGLSGTRQKGIDGKRIDLESSDMRHFLAKFDGHFQKMPERLGHLGCFQSHLEVYKKFLASNSRYCLILEDDSSFTTDDFKNILMTHLRRTDDWDILLFGYHIDSDWDDNHKYKNRDLHLVDGVLRNICYFTGLHCYVVSRSCAQRLLSYLRQPSWYIDWEISKLAYNKKLKICGVFPPVVCQPAAFKVKVNDIDYNYNCKYFKTTTNGDEL